MVVPDTPGVVEVVTGIVVGPPMGPFPVSVRLLPDTKMSYASKNPWAPLFPANVNLPPSVPGDEPPGTQTHPSMFNLFESSVKSPDVCQNRRSSKNGETEVLLIVLEKVISGATAVILVPSRKFAMWILVSEQ